MTIFTENEITMPDFIESAWPRLECGATYSSEKVLLPETFPLEQRIVLLEKVRQYALSQNGDLAVLEPFSDFRELVYERRPEPNLDQWL